MKHQRLGVNIPKECVTVRMSEHWHRFPREAVESPSLERCKSCLDMVLGSQLWVTLLEAAA